MQPPPLFRPQAVLHASHAAAGSILLARPLRFSLLVGFFTALVAILLTFIALSTYTRKAQVIGILLPSQGLIRLFPAHGGIVVRRHVQEGQSVRAGDPLFVIANERSDTANTSAERSISALLRARRGSFEAEQSQQQRQSAQKIEATRRRASELQADIHRLDAQVALQSRRVALAESTLERFTSLATSSFVSSAQVQDKQGELLDQQQRAAELLRAKAAIQRELLAAQAEAHDLALQAQRDQQASQRAIAALEQDLVENEARREVVVRAPQDGTVSAIAAEAGQSVSATQALASLVPSGSVLEAELYAPSRAAGFVKPGMEVLLRYQAFAYQKFGQARGTVREVASSAMRQDDLPLPGAAGTGLGAEPLYRVRVRLESQAVSVYGSPQALRTGALLDASILLERRRLYEWLLDPLYGAIGRV